MAHLPLRDAGRCGISWRDGAPLEGDASPQGFRTRIHGEKMFFGK